jgi:predicted membrane protein
MTNPGRLVIGLGLVLLGVLFLVDNVASVDAGDIVSKWWPILLVALGLIQIAGDRSNWLGPAVLIVIGLVLLGIRTEVLGDNVWTYVWPLALIGVGLWVVLGRGDGTTQVGNDQVNAVAIFTGRDVRVDSEAFTGGDVTVLLGSVNVDLTSATLVDGAVISATVMLGSLDILVPEGWRTSFTGTPILAGWDDTTRRDTVPADAPRLEVRALAILGGIEVRHPERWG